MPEDRLVTQRQLSEALCALRIMPGDTVMLHVSVKSLGWMVGGPDTILKALFDLLTPEGTLVMLISWEDNAYDFVTIAQDYLTAGYGRHRAVGAGQSYLFQAH